MQSRSSSVDGTDRVHGKKTMGNGKDRTKGEVGLSTYLETFRKFKKISVKSKGYGVPCQENLRSGDPESRNIGILNTLEYVIFLTHV